MGPHDALAPPGAAELRVLFVSGVAGGTRRCRVFQPMEQLALAGVPSTFRPAGDPAIYGDVLDHEVFIFHRVPYSSFVGDILDLVHESGKIAIYETDDLVFRPDMIEHDSYYRHLPPAQRRKHEAHVRDQRRTLARCDYTLTTTEFLADLLREEKPVLLHRNALGVEWIEWSAAAEAEVSKRGHQVVLGYVSGSKSHDYDFAEVADALAVIMGRYPQVVLRVVGHLEVTPKLAPFRDRIEEVAFIPWEKVPWELAAMDVNLAPLEQENPYCNSKSELKYIEASILGVPTIASRMQCFEHAIRPGDNGLLAGNLAEWHAALELLVADPDRRRKIGEAARADVLERYAPGGRGASFAAQLRAVVDQSRAVRPPPSRHDDTALAREIIRRMTGQLAEDDRWVVHDPDVKDVGVVRRREMQAQNVERLVGAVRRANHRPTARLVAWSKDLAKRVFGRSYRTKFGGREIEVLPPMVAGQEWRQSFTAEAAGLCAVDLLFGTFRRVNTCEVRATLFEWGADQPAAECVVAGHVLPDTQPFTLAFEPQPDSAGRRYELVLASPDAVPGDTVALWREVGAGPDGMATMEGNVGDALVMGGRQVPGRLVFSARYCPAGE